MTMDILGNRSDWCSTHTKQLMGRGGYNAPSVFWTFPPHTTGPSDFATMQGRGGYNDSNDNGKKSWVT
ncbi:hypothetical protein BDV24DRAFT_76344 [Aspergillus arachidicola]|uniref:Uncharacterized protein n=1 Tax=Aspergillus arachidicola TaxID=656916 RepID=A0A5N6Y1I1_9EURO|nr:hypothetical protein BDV24DRAFT_76344 [Aspergillus arachidicola]